ncbi:MULTISPECIES: VOC family protein [Methylobacterium]|uniref:VOC family protein n=1 Tax=Methylobacterium TaxID=407 RepID=UPI002F2BC486
MPKMIFVNLPVADVEHAAGFYVALGAQRDPRFSQAGTVAAMVFSDAIVVMLLSHAQFANFAPRAIADARAANEVLVCLSEESRAAVDASVERAVAAGGRADLRPPQEMGTFMYGRNIEDPDGHVVELMWMDPEAMTRGQAPA